MANKRKAKIIGILLYALVFGAHGAFGASPAKPEVEECFILLNDNERPASGIDVHVSSKVGWEPNRNFGRDLFDQKVVRSDEQGKVRVRISRGDGDISFEIAESASVYGQRWSKSVTELTSEFKPIYMKKREKPISMYIRDLGPSFPYWNCSLPSIDTPCEFDLLQGDWLPPFGDGKIGDISFRAVVRIPKTERNGKHDVSLELHFLGNSNGIIPARSLEPGPTSMPLPRISPETGYKDTIAFRTWTDSRGAVKSDFGDADDRTRGFFFRIRSVIGPNGELSSSRYGKIIGTISFRVMEDEKIPLKFWYFVSDLENDRNMEHRKDSNRFLDSDSAGRRLR